VSSEVKQMKKEGILDAKGKPTGQPTQIQLKKSPSQSPSIFVNAVAEKIDDPGLEVVKF
jgi:hypothetical protein